MDSQSTLARLIDETDVRRVRQVWAFARDHGEWDKMRACFHPDASVLVSWFSGPAKLFMERTVVMAAERRLEERSKHWFGNSRVAVKGDRAILETDALVLGRDWIDGYWFDYTMYVRMYDRMERRDGAWKILRMVVIYDKDRLDPVVPGAVPASFFAGLELTGPLAGIACMRFRSAKKGRVVPPELVLGGSDGEQKCRAETEAWLAAG